ncbi:unnamed protein product [Urochloa decumbens]|uniref:BTB domain-containing protein n=1 Tax=Urochloa decumbens TaxID=240449 RepID=A0ABC9BQY4_9POAL
MFGAGFVEVKLDYYPEKRPATGPFTTSESEDLSTGRHLWRINCSLRQAQDKSNGGMLLFSVTLVSKSQEVKAVFEAYLLNNDGTISPIGIHRFLEVYKPETPRSFSHRVQRNDLEMACSTTGFVRLLCGVIVVSESFMPMPPPDIGNHFGRLLDSGVGTDVSLIVGGEQFPAHRAVLAARSPVFQAELFGSMEDATMPSITVQEIEPAAFKVMLQFVYTDSLPEELGDSPTDMLQHLLAAADRFALDRLKLICSLKLIEYFSVDTVSSFLVCAETYNCPELKNKCLDFFAVEKNFKEAVFTDGFLILLQKFPSLAAELRKRVVNCDIT